MYNLSNLNLNHVKIIMCLYENVSDWVLSEIMQGANKH